ncbi:MAG: FAD:protein FMN transferase [Kiritimatiellae bacterium]|nr:FAD:protein FMN transferase [Kiritimatiellia bacterium]
MTDRVHRFEHQAMSTVFELLVIEDDRQLAGSAAYAVFQKVDKLEQLFSRFLDASEVALISRLKPGETFRVAPEMMDLLLVSTRICAATGGCFDVTVGVVMDALREVKHRWQALTSEERDNALAACGMNRLVIDTQNLLVSIKPDRLGRATPLELDFGAIAKGYALDMACEMLEKDWDFKDFLIHGGTSTVAARGSMEEGGAGWPVDVGGEWRQRAGLETVRLCGGALSGSGFEVKGAHVVDVRVGQAAARHGAAWAYAPKAAEADALSTASLAMKPAEIERACAELEGCGVMVARGQPQWMDRLCSPVRTFGAFPRA